jgi:uncharacterized membrane protein
MLVVAVDQETPQEAQQEPVVEQVAAAQVHQVLVQKELMELLLLVVVYLLTVLELDSLILQILQTVLHLLLPIYLYLMLILVLDIGLQVQHRIESL